jgi:putative RNA 2'-phosphotransferase
LTDRERKRLEKLLFYVLARRPDEFGLLPDKEGFVRLKDLHRVLTEEEGTKGLRLKKLKDFFLIFKPEAFEFREEEERVRACPDLVDPAVLSREPAEEVPAELYIPVRPRAWIKASEEGLVAETLILTPDRELAERMARRRGALVITVRAKEALFQGTIFERYLEKLYLSTWIPAEALVGPRVDEEFKKRYERPKKEKKEEPLLEETKVVLPPQEVPAFRKITKGRKKDPAWKKVRRERRRRG